MFHAKLEKNKDKLQHCILELVFKNPMRFIPIFHECIIFGPVVQVPQWQSSFLWKDGKQFHDCIRLQLLARKDARRLKY